MDGSTYEHVVPAGPRHADLEDVVDAKEGEGPRGGQDEAGNYVASGKWSICQCIDDGPSSPERDKIEEQHIPCRHRSDEAGCLSNENR